MSQLPLEQHVPKATNATGYFGVSFNTNNYGILNKIPYLSKIMVENKSITIGKYATVKEAAMAYDAEVLRYDAAALKAGIVPIASKLNFPNGTNNLFIVEPTYNINKGRSSSRSSGNNVAEPIQVLIRNNKNRGFCICCKAIFNETLSTYTVSHDDGTYATMVQTDVFPLAAASTLGYTLSNGANDVGRAIAVYYPPEDIWYCGKVEKWQQSHTNEDESAKLGIHSVRFDGNNQIEDIVLNQEKVVWMSDSAFSQKSSGSASSLF
jgi:hypothetical protein